MKKQGLTLIMMITSIALLLALQAIWLNNSYEKAFLDYRKEASELLRTAVFSVRDSVLFREIESVPADLQGTVRRFPTDAVFTTWIDSAVIAKDARDSVVDVKKVSEPQVQIYVSSRTSKDSIRTILKPYASRISEGNKDGGSRFLIRINHDSLKTSSIKTQLEKLVAGSKFDEPFEIKRSTVLPPFPTKGNIARKFDTLIAAGEQGPPESVSLFTRLLSSEWIKVDPIVQYAAVFQNFRPALIREIVPQIFFAIFLTAVTILSFILMYRSMLAQDRLMRLKNDFISNITHELKTPIATVSVALEALSNFKAKDNPKATEEYLDMARQELGRLTLLADKVLTTSLFDEPGIKLRFESIDLSLLISDVLQSMQLLFKKHNSTVQFDKEGLEFIIQGNHFHLTNAIYNLLDNALKYSPPGAKIHIGLHDLGKQIRIVVADKGYGIPPEYQGKVFEKFFRVPTGDIHNTKGYGLGLSYVQTVVNQHLGKVELHSQPGEGSSFEVTLPRIP